MKICHELFELQMGRQSARLATSEELPKPESHATTPGLRQRFGYYLIKLGQRLVHSTSRA